MDRPDRHSPLVERIYPAQIPDFVESAMDRLYGSLYASLPQLRLSTLEGVNTYAAWREGQLQALLLYTVAGRMLRVVNEGMQLEAETVMRFAALMFARHPEVARVHFRAIQPKTRPQSSLAASFALTEDMVIDLPSSEAAYMAALGKATRKTLRQGMARAGALVHDVYSGADITPALVEQIIDFNRARMLRKQRESALDDEAADRLRALLRARGIAGAVRLHGRLCAGTLACRFGEDIYSLVNAHDPAFDTLGMGNISRHLMITAAIRSGVRRFHLLGGHLASKQSALAQRIPLEDLLIYRHRGAQLRDAPQLARLQLASLLQAWRSALEDQQRERQAGTPLRTALWAARRLRAGWRSGRQWLRQPLRSPVQSD